MAPMKLESLAKPEVQLQPVYEPGKPIEDVAREPGGRADKDPFRAGERHEDRFLPRRQG